MFITTPYSQVIALNAATGDLLWRYKRPLPEGFSALDNTNRGVALFGDKVYFAPLDAALSPSMPKPAKSPGGEDRGLEAGLLHDDGPARG